MPMMAVMDELVTCERCHQTLCAGSSGVASFVLMLPAGTETN
jgi:hypothetical protein